MVRGSFTASTILSAGSFQIRSELGEFVQAAGVGEGVVVNGDTNVIAADVQASNGVIHGVDAVLVPSFVSTDIVSTTQNAGAFETLLALAGLAELVDALQEEGLTVFAPTDAAFDKLPQELVDALVSDPTGALRDVLLYHVVPAVVPRAKVTPGTAVTANGAALELSYTRLRGSRGINLMVIGASMVVQSDVFASNGVIHVIDEVLIPPELDMDRGNVDQVISQDSRLSILNTVLEVTGLNETLSGDGPFTILAPTDNAFAELGQETIDSLLADLDTLTDILLYHAFGDSIRRFDLSNGIVAPLNGDNLLVKTLRAGVAFNKFALVEQFDIAASYGIIHVIDSVLLPPPSVVGIAASSSLFSTLVAAVQAADLVGTLEGPGPWTVFAPTDAAFAKLPDGLLETLLADPQGSLREILLYHVVSGNVLLADLTDGPVTPVQGEAINVKLNFFQGSSSFVRNAVLNDASGVFVTDTIASNGVIHIIDSVLVPPSIAATL